jgi:hypothetical protein
MSTEAGRYKYIIYMRSFFSPSFVSTADKLLSVFIFFRSIGMAGLVSLNAS